LCWDRSGFGEFIGDGPLKFYEKTFRQHLKRTMVAKPPLLANWESAETAFIG
jgi:hypothetical protein